MLKVWPEAIGAVDTVFWPTKVDKYLNRSGSFEAMFIILLSHDESDFGGLNGEHLL